MCAELHICTHAPAIIDMSICPETFGLLAAGAVEDLRERFQFNQFAPNRGDPLLKLLSSQRVALLPTAGAS